MSSWIVLHDITLYQGNGVFADTGWAMATEEEEKTSTSAWGPMAMAEAADSANQSTGHGMRKYVNGSR